MVAVACMAGETPRGSPRGAADLWLTHPIFHPPCPQCRVQSDNLKQVLASKGLEMSSADVQQALEAIAAKSNRDDESGPSASLSVTIHDIDQAMRRYQRRCDSPLRNAQLPEEELSMSSEQLHSSVLEKLTAYMTRYSTRVVDLFRSMDRDGDERVTSDEVVECLVRVRPCFAP